MAKQKETKLTDNLNLVLQFPHGGGTLPIRLMFDEGTTESVRTLLKNLGKRENIETKVFACKGANNRLGEVTVIASAGDNYLKIRCPRLQDGLKYVLEGVDRQFEYHTPCCYEAEDLQNVPVVKEEEFAFHKIFRCPYAK